MTEQQGLIEGLGQQNKTPEFYQECSDEIKRLQKAWDSCFKQLMSNVKQDKIGALLVSYGDELKERQLGVDVEMIAEAEGKVEAIEECLRIINLNN